MKTHSEPFGASISILIPARQVPVNALTAEVGSGTPSYQQSSWHESLIAFLLTGTRSIPIAHQQIGQSRQDDIPKNDGCDDHPKIVAKNRLGEPYGRQHHNSEQAHTKSRPIKVVFSRHERHCTPVTHQIGSAVMQGPCCSTPDKRADRTRVR